MRTTCILIAFFLVLTLSGCATSTNNTTNSHTSEKKSTNLSENTIQKNPLTVALFKGKEKPKKPYVILGKETISKYNKVGIKRQEANILDVMRHMAASAGGDAIINISHDAKTVTGTIIAFKTTQKNKPERA